MSWLNLTPIFSNAPISEKDGHSRTGMLVTHAPWDSVVWSWALSPRPVFLLPSYLTQKPDLLSCQSVWGDLEWAYFARRASCIALPYKADARWFKFWFDALRVALSLITASTAMSKVREIRSRTKPLIELLKGESQGTYLRQLSSITTVSLSPGLHAS